MTEEIKKVPAGILAEAVLRDEAATDQPPAPSTPSPAILPVDPNYHEPTPHVKFVETADKISRDAQAAVNGEEVFKAMLAQNVLINFLLGRVLVLETALKPFCVTGTMLANAQMALAAEGDVESPAGGTWISNPPQGIQLQPTQGYFYAAIDALGRKATEEHMAAIFQRVQDANKLQAEKAAHIEAGGRADH